MLTLPTRRPSREPNRPRSGSHTTRHRLALRHALAQLTPKQRAVIVLRFFEDRTERETAQLMGVSIGTVKSQTHYALSKLCALTPEEAYR
ncbi:sigma-70 family RNA polymerase sigma factor [Nonomuraea sp. KM88]|uniref:sigma-70 family RNA polymerase sigma factor n=1 Tax=Nonomuraea sp. KM88 TaxID=3457427 RepID=UPI003FCE01F0